MIPLRRCLLSFLSLLGVVVTFLFLLRITDVVICIRGCHKTDNTPHLKEAYIPDYEWHKDIPVHVGSIADEAAYFRIKCSFRRTGSTAYPNLFQTAPINSGLRLELTSTSLGFIVHDAKADNHIRGVVVPWAGDHDWHVLELEAQRCAYLKISLDGKPVALCVSPSLDFSVSDIRVGGGFDLSRPFDGDIRNISMVYGAFPRLNDHSTYQAYCVLAGLLAATMVCFYFAFPPMGIGRRLILRLFVLIFPISCLLMWREAGLSTSNTNYFVKRLSLEDHLQNTRVLVTGSSNAIYGIDPSSFTVQGYNLGFPNNSMYLDGKLIERYAPMMPKLKIVVMTVNYFTMGTDYRNMSQSWREYFVRQYFDVRPEFHAYAPLDIGYLTDPSYFSKISIYGAEADQYARESYLRLVDIVAQPNGWFDAGLVPCDPSLKRGEAAAASQNESTSITNYSRNLSFWNASIACLLQRDIKPVIVVMPLDESTRTYLDTEKLRAMRQALTEYCEDRHIGLKNYLADPRFSESDFSWELPDHLNARGAKRLGRILDAEIIRPTLGFASESTSNSILSGVLP